MKEEIDVLADEDGNRIETVRYDGDLILPAAFRQFDMVKMIKYVRELPYEDGDTIVCSFPKTGTHWVINLVHFLHSSGPLESVMSNSPHLIDILPLDSAKNLGSPRMFVSHHKPQRLPAEHLQKNGKIVLTIRNPKDTAVSQYHMMRKSDLFGKDNLSWNSFIQFWMEGRLPTGSYFDHYNCWQKEIENNPKMNIHVIRYELLKLNPLNELRKLQTFLGLELPDSRLEEVIQRCSLDKLREDVNSGKLKSQLVDNSGKSILYRKGVVGDWKSHFTVAQNEQMDALMKEKFAQSIFRSDDTE